VFRPCGEADEIPGAHVLWRRVLDDLDHLEWDGVDGCWRARPTPPSNSLQFNPDMSTVWREHAAEVHGVGPECALDEAHRYTLVFAIEADAARELDLEVAHSPTGTECPNCAHSSVLWPTPITKDQKKELRYELSRALRLIYGMPTVQPPPQGTGPP